MVTIAIPTYNGKHLIEDALKSILLQKGDVSKVIIIDDFSPDTTFQKAEYLKEKYNQLNIEVFQNKKNIGYQANWNKCFEYCETKYLVILHQDDMLFENTIQRQLKYLNENIDIALVGGKEDGIDESGRIYKKHSQVRNEKFLKGQIYEFMSRNGSYIPCSSVMFDMEKVRHVGFFDTNVLGTDEIFWPKVLSSYPIAILGESLIYRRNHPGQAEWSDFYKKKQEVIISFKRFSEITDLEKRLDKKKEISKLINRKFCLGLIGIAGAVIRYYHSSKLAFWYLRRVIIVDPLFPFKSFQFWKILLIIIVNSLGLIGFFKAIKKKRLV